MNLSTSPNRRSEQEKRGLDFGPPLGLDERRGLPERRHPQVGYIDFDEHIELGSADDALYYG